AVVERAPRRRDHARVRRQSEVIVRAEVDHLVAVGRDVRGLRRRDRALVLPQPCGLDLGERCGEHGLGGRIHAGLLAGGRRPAALARTRTGASDPCSASCPLRRTSANAATANANRKSAGAFANATAGPPIIANAASVALLPSGALWRTRTLPSGAFTCLPLAV